MLILQFLVGSGLVAIMVQIGVISYWAGQIKGAMQGLTGRVQRIESWIDDHDREV